MFILILLGISFGSEYYGCDPNYARACIPDVDYDLDCDSVIYNNFLVVGHDKHHFDRDRDSIACEQ